MENLSLKDIEYMIDCIKRDMVKCQKRAFDYPVLADKLISRIEKLESIKIRLEYVVRENEYKPD